jgi:outer membrane protein TolC
MLLAAALLLAGVPAWAGAATPAPRPSVTLEQAISRAMTQDPRMVKARGDQAVAAAAQKSAFGNYLPNLSVSASVGASQTNVPAATDVAGSAGAGVSLGYDLFTGFRRGAQTTQADAQATQAQAALTGNAANVALGVEQTFFVTLQAKELLEVANARLRTAQEALDAAKRKAAAGLGTRSDQLRAEVELNSAQQALLEAKTQADVQAYALGRQIGVDGPVDAQIDASAPVQDAAFDGEAFIQELLSSAPDLVSAQAQLRAADAGVQVAKSSYLPQVSASAGYDWNTRFDPALPGNAGWSVRVGISLPLFDGFARDESLTRAESQARTAQATLADTRRGLRATAEQLLGALELSDSKITLAQKSVAAAEEDLRVQQQRYAEGVSTMLDLLTSEAGATQARTGLVQARFDYRVARAQLLALAGKVS